MSYTQFRIVDAESTGPNSTPPDVACELASVDYNAESSQLMAPRTDLIQIGIPMPPDAQGVHHISDQELNDKGKSIAGVFKSIITPYPYPQIVLVAHNAEYEFGTVRDADGKLLKDYLEADVPIICTLKVAYRLWPDAPNHKNQTLRYYLKLDVPEKLRGGLPHRALPDAIVTALMLKEALKLATPEQMIQWTKEPRLLPTCPIGKKQGWAGKKWTEVDAGFLGWMLGQEEMELDLKWNAQRELDRRTHARATVGRDTYMAAIPAVIKVAKTIFDLRQWFAGEKGSRDSLGILDGTDEYATILRLCNEHKATLAPPVEVVATPAALPLATGSMVDEMPEDDEPDLTAEPAPSDNDDDLTRVA